VPPKVFHIPWRRHDTPTEHAVLWNRKIEWIDESWNLWKSHLWPFWILLSLVHVVVLVDATFLSIHNISWFVIQEKWIREHLSRLLPVEDEDEDDVVVAFSVVVDDTVLISYPVEDMFAAVPDVADLEIQSTILARRKWLLWTLSAKKTVTAKKAMTSQSPNHDQVCSYGWYHWRMVLIRAADPCFIHESHDEKIVRENRVRS
jgi:hypothetical protein